MVIHIYMYISYTIQHDVSKSDSIAEEPHVWCPQLIQAALRGRMDHRSEPDLIED